MKYIIYEKERPQLFVKYINSDNSVTLTNVENDAMQFDTEDDVGDIISTIGGSDFWGTRPTRPHNR